MKKEKLFSSFEYQLGLVLCGVVMLVSAIFGASIFGYSQSVSEPKYSSWLWVVAGVLAVVGCEGVLLVYGAKRDLEYRIQSFSDVFKTKTRLLTLVLVGILTLVLVGMGVAFIAGVGVFVVAFVVFWLLSSACWLVWVAVGFVGWVYLNQQYINSRLSKPRKGGKRV